MIHLCNYTSAVDQVVYLNHKLEVEHETAHRSLAFAWGRIHELEEKLEELEKEQIEHGSYRKNLKS